ncbi:MAG: FAD-dependent oxidoreductase [Kofleriaceae bacterium]
MRIAIIGSGISGLGAAHALAPHHEVTVFEAAPTLGGHVHTVTVPGRRGPLAVDMGFIVCNRDNYPRFFRLLDELGVATRPTSMSFSVSLPHLGVEWGSASLGAVFADRRRLFDRRHWRMLLGVLGFLRRAQRDLAAGGLGGRSLDEYLADAGVDDDVREQFIVPLAAALWSLAPARCGAFPAVTYLRFLDQHGMLRPVRPLAWRTIVGGSRRYVEALQARLPVTWRTGCPVERVHRDAHGVTVIVDGAEARFDRVILATHADTALALLAAPTADEARLLGSFRYSQNHTVLHGDVDHLPARAAARASWNYVADADRGQVAVTYWMNARCEGFVDEAPQLTLNPRRPMPGRRPPPRRPRTAVRPGRAGGDPRAAADQGVALPTTPAPTSASASTRTACVRASAPPPSPLPTRRARPGPPGRRVIRSALYGHLTHTRRDRFARRTFRYPVYVAAIHPTELAALDQRAAVQPQPPWPVRAARRRLRRRRHRRASPPPTPPGSAPPAGRARRAARDHQPAGSRLRVQPGQLLPRLSRGWARPRGRRRSLLPTAAATPTCSGMPSGWPARARRASRTTASCSCRRSCTGPCATSSGSTRRSTATS